MTVCIVCPERISCPPMISGISTFSPAMLLSRAFSSRFSGEPGAYDRTGSLTGGGTWRLPLNPLMPSGTYAVRAVGVGSPVASLLADAAVRCGCVAGADMSIPLDERRPLSARASHERYPGGEARPTVAPRPGEGRRCPVHARHRAWRHLACSRGYSPSWMDGFSTFPSTGFHGAFHRRAYDRHGRHRQ